MLIGVDASRALIHQRTGTENYSLYLLRHLVEVGAEHHFRLYVPRPAPTGLFPDRPNVAFQIVRAPRLWTHLGLSRELRHSRPDVLFVPAHVLPLVCPCPGVVAVHDLGYLFYPQAHSRFDRWYLNLTNRRHVRQAAAIVTLSQASKGDMVEHYGADPTRIHVTYPGYDETLKPMEKRTALAVAQTQYGIKTDYFLFLGTVQPRKNLFRLVQAFAQVRAQGHTCQLVIGGKSGRWHERLETQIGDLGLRDQVVLTGYVKEIHKRGLLSGAVAFVFPSLYEGFGLPVLEAQACGAPVICSNTTSLPEAVGESALLVDPLNVDEMAQAMTRLLTDEGLQADLTDKGDQNLPRFSWRRCAQETLQVLTGV